MSIEKITEAEIAAASVSRLADRPNRGAAGKAPLTAEEVKRAFDALGRLNAERYNALVDAVTDGSLATALATADGETLEALSTRVTGIRNAAVEARLASAEAKADATVARSDAAQATAATAAMEGEVSSLSTRVNAATQDLGAVVQALAAHASDMSLHGAAGAAVGGGARWYTNNEYNALPDRASKPPLLFHVKMQWDSSPYRVHGGFASAQMRRGVLFDLSNNLLRLYVFAISEGEEIHLSGDTVTMYSVTFQTNGTVSVTSEVVVLWNYWVEVLA